MTDERDAQIDAALTAELTDEEWHEVFASLALEGKDALGRTWQ